MPDLFPAQQSTDKPQPDITELAASREEKPIDPDPQPKPPAKESHQPSLLRPSSNPLLKPIENPSPPTDLPEVPPPNPEKSKDTEE